jgi:hypothetical protein
MYRINAFLTSFCLIFFTAPVLAEVYTWIDENGDIHATDDASQVPPRYRSGGASKQTPPDSSTNWNMVETPPAASPPPQPSPPEPSLASDEPSRESEEQYGGRTEQEWRASYARIDDLRARTEVCRQSLRLATAAFNAEVELHMDRLRRFGLDEAPPPNSSCDFSAYHPCAVLLRDLRPEHPDVPKASSKEKIYCSTVETLLGSIDYDRMKEDLDLKASQYGVPFAWRGGSPR